MVRQFKCTQTSFFNVNGDRELKPDNNVTVDKSDT